LREVNDEEYRYFASLSSKFGQFLMEMDFYKVLDHAYKDLIRFLNELLERKSSFEKYDVNRYAMNYLFSIRTFLDHWETRIKRKYRSNQQYLDLFKKVTSQEYDNHMAYRIVYRLRNYVQHCEMPISNVIERFNDNNEKEIIVCVNRDRLLSNFKEWKPEEVEYLKVLEQNIEILPLFEEMNACLFRIHQELINFNFDKNSIMDCVSVLKLRRQFKEYEGSLAVVEYSDEGIRKEGEIFTKDRTTLKINQLPTEECKAILQMHIRNNERYVKMFDFCGICVGETKDKFPYSIGKDENGVTLFLKGKEIIKVNNINWIRLTESMSIGGAINYYVAAYADMRFEMKELKELTEQYSNIGEVLYKTS